MNILKSLLTGVLLFLVSITGNAQDVDVLSSTQNQKNKSQNTTSDNVNQKRKKPAKKQPKTPRLKPEVESRIDQFVKANHPELKKVLKHLKTKPGNDYYRAMMQIKKTADRLEGYRKRDPERYRIDLKMWQVQSRINLLAAEIAVNNKSKLKNKLRNAIRDENALKIRRIELERSRIVARLKRLNEQETKLELKPEAIDKLVNARINRFKPKQVKRKKKPKKNDRRKKDKVKD